MVRIAKEDISSLLLASKKCFGNTARVWLFGSRADDAKFGGDIDLYIETDMTNGLIQATLLLRKHLMPLFGEQKIDIITRSRHEELQSFHLLAKESGVELQ